MLGRQLELGFPDTERVSTWIKPFFPNIMERSFDDAALWQVAESLSVITGGSDADPSPSDLALAALFAGLNRGQEVTHGYRALLIGAKKNISPSNSFELPAAPAASGDPAAAALHQALESCAQRRLVERLIDDMAAERSRERAEFTASVSSLATELREVEAQAEFLARELRSREHTISNQSAALAEVTARFDQLTARFNQVQEAQRAFEASRAGRALALYTRGKSLLRILR